MHNSNIIIMCLYNHLEESQDLEGLKHLEEGVRTSRAKGNSKERARLRSRDTNGYIALDRGDMRVRCAELMDVDLSCRI